MKKTYRLPKRRPGPALIVWRGGQTLESRREQIRRLLDEEQPFVLARYSVSSPFVTDAWSWAYELILWQTRAGEEEQQSLVMDAITFRHLIREFNMYLAEQNDDGAVYECNSLLRDLTAQWREDMEPCRLALAAAHRALSLKKEDRCRSMTLALWDRYREAKASFAEADGRFALEHSIHIYRFSGIPGEEYEEEALAMAVDAEGDS